MRDRIGCPVLVQIADFDRSAPPHAAAKAAFKARAEVRHYPCDHFDVWPGKPWFEPSVAHQVGVPVARAHTAGELTSAGAYAVPRSSRTQSSSPSAAVAPCATSSRLSTLLVAVLGRSAAIRT